MTPREQLRRSVRRVRRIALVQGIARTFLAALAGAGVGPLASTAVLSWISGSSGVRGAVVWGFACLGACVGAGLAWAEWRRAEPRLPWSRAGDLLASLHPSLRNVVHTGADLAAWGEDGAETRGASPALAAGHLERAAAAAASLNPGSALPARRAVPAAGAACTVAVLVGAWVWWNPGRSVDAWTSLGAPSPPRAVTLGNLKLVYEPPAYTGLPSSTLEGVSGAVEALPGTRVTLQGQLSEPVQGGRWKDSDGRVASMEVKGRAFRVTWVLQRAGTYDLSFERGGRRVPSDFQRQPMTLRADERPKAELQAPATDLEIAGDREVEVEFSAVDDFRVDRVDLVLQGEIEVRVPVRVTPGAAVAGKARFLPLAYPKLGAGAHLRVEARDSDNVSGPKVGVSRSVYLSFLDRRKVLDDIRALEERLFEALLAHLADHLEAAAPKGEEAARLRGRASDLLKLFEALSSKLRQFAQSESSAAAALWRMEDGLKAALGPFAAGAGERGAVVAELERDVLFLEKLMKNLQMEEALRTGDELSALQRSLFDDLQAGRSPKDLLDRISRIEKTLSKLSEQLSRGPREMPDAFLNADAVKDMPSNELQRDLQRLKEALKAGRTNEARALAEKILSTLNRWLRSLQDAAERAAGLDSDPAMKEMARLESEVQGLVGDQENVLQETRSLGEEGSKRAAESIRRELVSALNRLDQRLNAILELARRTEALAERERVHPGLFGPPAPGAGRPAAPVESPPETGSGERSGASEQPNPPGPGGPANAATLFDASSRVSSAVADVRQALRTDLGRARSGVEAIRESFHGLRQTVESTLDGGDSRRERAGRLEASAEGEIQALLRELDGLDQRRLKALTMRELQSLRSLAGQEERLGRRTRDLADKLEELSHRTPFVGSGLPRQARSAQRRMGQAGEKLGQGNPYGAVPPENDALEDLSGIARALEEARRQALRGKGGGGGFSLMGFPGGEGGAGGRGVDRSRVEIPKEAEARELKAFREEVLKAMRRGGFPKNYEEEVERYYERLIR